MRNLLIFFFITSLLFCASCKHNIEHWINELEKAPFEERPTIVWHFRNYNCDKAREKIKEILFSTDSKRYDNHTKTMCIRVLVEYDDIKSFNILKKFYYDKSIPYHKEFALVQLTNFSKGNGKDIFYKEIKSLIKSKKRENIIDILINQNLNINVDIDDSTINNLKKLDVDGRILSSIFSYYINTNKKNKLIKIIDEDLFKQGLFEQGKAIYLADLITLIPMFYDKLSDRYIERIYKAVQGKNIASIRALVMLLFYGDKNIVEKSFNALKNYKLDTYDVGYLKDVGKEEYYTIAKVKDKVINVDKIFEFFRNTNKAIKYEEFFK